MADTSKTDLESRVGVPQQIISSFLDSHPAFEAERDEITDYFSLVISAVREIDGDKRDEGSSRLGLVAKKKAIEIIRRHSNGHEIQHKAPLVDFMSNIWEIAYRGWEEAKNEREAQT